MKRTLFHAAALAAVLLASGVAHAQAPVALRNTIESSGPAVTLGDFFENAGPAAGRAVAPAPGAGRTATFSPRFLQAAARAAGLDWTPPDGMTAVLVTGRGGAAGVVSPRFQSTASQNASLQHASASVASGDIAVRRGETVTLVYVSQGLQLTTRARALGDASIGDSVRLVNLTSNRTVDAVVTGIGAASARAN